MEEIVVQSIGNAPQQGNVDAVLAENLVHMRPRTANVFGQPCGRNALLSHDFFDMLPDVHRKSVELISCFQGDRTVRVSLLLLCTYVYNFIYLFMAVWIFIGVWALP